MEARRALGRRPSFSTPSSCDTVLSRGAIVCSSKLFGSLMMDRPSEECDERGEGVNLDELSVLGEAGSRGLRREDDERGMIMAGSYYLYAEGVTLGVS
jgi:hypothetical protein